MTDHFTTNDTAVEELGGTDTATEAPPRRRRRWLPIVALVLAVGAVAGAVVVRGAADDDRSTAQAAQRRADERLVQLEDEAQEHEADLAELVGPSHRFLGVATEAADAADRATELDVDEMALNRSSVRYGILESVAEYNRVIDKLNARYNEQYQAALELYQLMNQLRAIQI